MPDSRQSHGFGSSGVFPVLIKCWRRRILVNAGLCKSYWSETLRRERSNWNQCEYCRMENPSPLGCVRLILLNHHYAMEALKNQETKCLYISYGETDDWAHDNKYDQSHRSATAIWCLTSKENLGIPPVRPQSRTKLRWSLLLINGRGR